QGTGQTLCRSGGTGRGLAAVPVGRADPGEARRGDGANLALVSAQSCGSEFDDSGGGDAAPGDRDGELLRRPGGTQGRRGPEQRRRGEEGPEGRPAGGRREGATAPTSRNAVATGRSGNRREGKATAQGRGRTTSGAAPAVQQSALSRCHGVR